MMLAIVSTRQMGANDLVSNWSPSIPETLLGFGQSPLTQRALHSNCRRDFFGRLSPSIF